MRYKGLLWLSGLTLLAALVAMRYFIAENVPGEIGAEISDTIKDLSSPGNPTYTTYKNMEYGFSFEHPSSMQVAAGPSENNSRFAVFVYPGFKKVRHASSITGEEQLMGIHVFQNRTFETEVSRVGGGRRDLVENIDFNGYKATKIKEHHNPVNDFQEEALVVDRGDLVVSFFISRKENNTELRSFYDHMLGTFQFEQY